MLLIGAQSPNPRGINNTKNIRSQEVESNAGLRRSATSVITKTVSARNRSGHAVVTARPSNATSNLKIRSARPVVSNAGKSRSATGPAVVRSGINVKKANANIARVGKARATAVFNDISKIGGGYSDCRDSYATCMDQMCANANDTYRRCFCSDRFSTFRDTADKLDAALGLLAEFQDNNLNAVDKTAAEVNAMYTATAGEAAIKKDTSASQKLLDSIGDVLSGKSTPKKQNLTSLGVLDLSGFGDGSDDIFGGGSSLFGGSDTTNLAELEGKALYDAAAKQCAEISRAACGSDAMFNLAKSAYSIMITQDCNAYEKNINAKKASVEETVRTAEKYLREARLEEYRTHNSADVNECLTKVETAIRQPTACGENYEKCMDYTGLYINASTGEPIYSQALFGLNSLIVLDGGMDVLGANPDFNKVLDSKKVFAETALDSCRDLADTVWYEFKRSAIIQIAQAQDEKIQEVKDSCVLTIRECYDTQSGALQDMDTSETKGTGAIAAVVARGMCYDRVQACAALYGDPNGCKYDDETKKLEPVAGKKCGLQSLLTFVDTVDSVKIAEGCETVLTKYAKEICPDSTATDPTTGEETTVPYGSCANKLSQVRAAMETRRQTFCAADLMKNDESNTIRDASYDDAFNTNIMNQIIKSIYDEIGIAFTSGCEDEGGVWKSGNEISNPTVEMLEQKFYKKYYGVTITAMNQIDDLELKEVGWCITTNGQAACEDLGSNYATYGNGKCNLTDAWYTDTCINVLHGRWSNGQCEVDVQNPDQPEATFDATVAETTTNGFTLQALSITDTPKALPTTLKKLQKVNN